MFGIGPWELAIIFGIVLVLFGGKRLPGLATGLGTAIRNFRTALKEPEQQEVGQKHLQAKIEGNEPHDQN